jgi:hypothetical protein
MSLPLSLHMNALAPHILPILLALLAVATPGSSSSSFVHPGVLVSGAQLGAIQAALASHTEPFASMYAKAVASPWANTSWAPRGPPASLVIECGGYSKPDHGCSDEGADADAAYTQALLYHLDGSPAYAQAAIRIMNMYAKTQKYNNTNAPLQASWGASMWTRAAELIIHSDAGWPSEDAAAFRRFLTDVSLPLLYNGSNANGNWELSMIEGMMGIAVLNEDASLLAHAASLWSSRIPAYFFLSSADGDKPVPLPHRPGGQGPPNTQGWYGQKVFDASVDGICQELCRDAEHTQMGMASAMNAAETARIQGLDLFLAEKTRLTAAMEFHARVLLGESLPHNVCDGHGVADQNVTYPTYEVGFHFYNTIQNISLPYSLKHIVQNVRPLPDPVNRWMMAWETLTHG